MPKTEPSADYDSATELRNYHDVRVHLRKSESLALREAFQQAGRPTPSHHLGHNPDFAEWVRCAIVEGRQDVADPSKIDVELAEPDGDDGYMRIPISLTEEEYQRAYQIGDSMSRNERYRRNGRASEGIRQMIIHWLEGVTK